MVELITLQIVAPNSVTKKVILQFVCLVLFVKSKSRAQRDFRPRDLGQFDLAWRFSNLQQHAMKIPA
jgi:hypothetical protein